MWKNRIRKFERIFQTKDEVTKVPYSIYITPTSYNRIWYDINLLYLK